MHMRDFTPVLSTHFEKVTNQSDLSPGVTPNCKDQGPGKT